MSTEQLTLISESIHLPGKDLVSFTARGLSFVTQTTESELIEIGKRLFAIRGYVKWSLGSLFAEMLKKRPHPDSKDHANDYETAWVSEFCSAHDLDPKDRREMLGVFTFYQSCKTTPPLSFEHHREAMWGASNGQPGALERALDYLTLAYADGLSVTALRAVIRKQERTAPKEDKQLELAALSWVYDMRRYAAREIEHVATYSPERARLILADLGADALTYIDALRVIARQDGQPLATVTRSVAQNGKARATA